MGRTSIILRVVSFFLGVTIQQNEGFGAMGIVRPESHSTVGSTCPEDNQAHTSNPVGSIHSNQDGLWFWFGGQLFSTQLIGFVCPQTMSSILLELRSASHEHVGQFCPRGSNIVPNLERRHLEALRVKFGPFKLHLNGFSESSFM